MFSASKSTKSSSAYLEFALTSLEWEFFKATQDHTPVAVAEMGLADGVQNATMNRVRGRWEKIIYME